LERITLTGLASYFSPPTSNSGPTDVVVGSDKNIWFTEENLGNIAKFTGLQNSYQRVGDPSGCCCCGGGPDTQVAQTGDMHTTFPVDFNQSTPTKGDYLVYNSNTVNVLPIIETTFHTDSGATLPSTIQDQLTWNNGTPQSAVSFSTTGHNPGDTFLFDVQVASAVTATGNYPFQIQITAGSVTRFYSGNAYIAVNGSSDALGQGITLAAQDSLVADTQGVMFVKGDGFSRYFPNGPTTTYISPGFDFGTLVKNGDGSYTYTEKDQTKENFNSSGQLTSVVDSDGVAVTYSYSSGNLSTVSEPDGGVATLQYSSGLLSKILEPGGRTVTIGHDASGNLTSVTNPDGGLRTLTYDSADRLVTDAWGPLKATMTYDTAKSVLTQIDRGGGATTQISSANTVGFATSPAKNASQAVGVTTDALSHPTTYSLDPLGYTTQLQTPDGGIQIFARDCAEQCTAITDQLGRTTTYTYAYGPSDGDLVQITNPDGSAETFQYDPTFHKVTQQQDTRGDLTTSTYDTSTGDLLTTKDALNEVTTQTWSGGLLQTVTDPLNHTATYQWDTAHRRLTDTIDPLNNRTTYGYDAAGNQITVKDALGRVTTTAFDGMRRATTVTDANGGVVTMTYNAIGELLTQTDQLGHQTQNGYDMHGWQTSTTQAVGTSVQAITTMAYDVLGRLTAQTDANNHTTSYGYDAVGRQITQTSPVGGVQTSTYDLAGQLIASTDPLNHTTTFGYNLRGWQTSVKDALGNLSTSLYDTEGNVTVQIDANSNRTTMLYDALNREYQTTNAIGGISTVLFDAAGNSTATIDELGRRTTYSFDPLNRQTQVQDALGDLSTTIYDAVSNVTVSIDPLGDRTTMAYDVLNRQTTTTDPMGFISTTAYDAASNVTSTSNARGYTTTFAYDASNRQTQVTNGLGGLATTVYDLASNVIAQVDERGDRTTFGYDAANRRTTQTDSLNHTVTTVYDLAGNVIKTIDALGFTTTMNYDADNRRTSVVDPSGGIVTTVYDAVGNVTNTIDQLGNTTTFVFDALSRQTQVIDPRIGITTTLYDAVGNATNIIDSVGNKTTFVFDALNRETQMIDPLGNSATFAYDKASRMTSVTDRDGRRRDFSFDNDRRKIRETWVVSGSTTDLLTFSYDKNSNLVTAADYHGAYTMAYDALDRMTAVQEPFGQILTSIFDPVGNRTVLQDSLGGTMTSIYDAANRLTTREFGGSGQTPLRINMSYTTRNQLATETRYSDLAGTQTVGYSTLTYDAGSRLINLDHQNGSGTNLANYTYGYDLANRLTTETLNGGAPTTYGYDVTNQLATVVNSSGTTTFGYDLNGNRTNTGYVTGSENQLTTDGTYSYTYDKEGNLITKTNISTSEQWTFGYDNLNHMISAIDKNSSGTTLTYATYLYDVFGNRIEKDVWQTGGSTTTMRFSWDHPVDPSGLGGGGNIWADLNSSNGLVTRYILSDGLDQLIARISSSGAAAWFLNDRLGSVRNFTDNSGSLIDTITYDGFGNITTESRSSNGGRFKFTGREFDSETGFQFNRARYYDPKTGRWTSQDPLGFEAGDANIYRYAINSPTNHLDPKGLQKKDQVCFTSIEIDDKHNWTNRGTTMKVGEIGDKTSFAYGFTVEIKADVSPGYSIEKYVDDNKDKLRQEAFTVTQFYENGGFDDPKKWNYIVADKAHPKGADGQTTKKADAMKALNEFFNTYSPPYMMDRVVNKDLFSTRFANYDHDAKHVKYYDAPLFLNRPNDDPATISADRYELIGDLEAIRVFAEGTDGKKIDAKFWYYRQAKSENGKWTFVEPRWGPDPKLPHTWTPK
jgi:RHS repeat-associated protein